MKKRLVIAILALTLAVSPAAAKSVTVGFSQATLDSPFYVSLMEAAEAKAKTMGGKLVYLDAQLDIAKQNKDVRDLITRGVDILLLNPVNPNGVAPALEAAARAGVPVIAVDRDVNGKVATFVGRDNKLMGQEAGKLAVELLGGKGQAKGKIIEIQGDAGGTVMMARRDGFHLPVDAEKGLTVIQGPYSEYIRANAVKAFQDLYQAHPDVALVYAHNDDMALGALQVLRQNGKAGQVKIVGVDGLMEAVKTLAAGKGEYHGTIMNDPAKLGVMAVETAYGVLDGKSYPPFIDAGTAVIDAKNAKDFVDETQVFAVQK